MHGTEELRDAVVPALNSRERSALAARHYRVESERLGITDQYVSVLPYCAACREPWGEYGCSTRRALTLLAHAEHGRSEAQAKVRDLTDALGDLTARDKFRSDDSNLIAASIYVEAAALRLGGVSIIDGALHDLRAQFVDWLENEMRDPREEAAKAFNASLADQRRRRERGE